MEKTVREQLVAALEEEECWLDRLSNSARPPKGVYERRTALALALERHRAEPECGDFSRREALLVALDELFGCHPRSIPYPFWTAAREAFEAARSELQCPDGCDTSCPCYQEGLEAQREPAGRGTP